MMRVCSVSLMHLCLVSAMCRLVFGAAIPGDNIVASVDEIQKKFATAGGEQQHNELDIGTDKTVKDDGDTKMPIEKETNDKQSDESNRRDKMLDYYGFYNSAPYYPAVYPPAQYYPVPVPYAPVYNPYYPPEVEDYGDGYESSNNVDDGDDGSRANTRRRPTSGNQNSPIFYIRLPPTPYMFVPGMGYVSQPPTIQPIAPQYGYPPPQPMSPFINLPVNFVSNGKPTGVYQWQPPPTNYASPQYPSYLPPRPQRPYRPKPNYSPDSKVTHLKGPYVFNGRPEDVYVLPNPHYHPYSSPYPPIQNPYQPPPASAPIPQHYNGYQPIYGPPPQNYY